MLFTEKKFYQIAKWGQKVHFTALLWEELVFT